MLKTFNADECAAFLNVSRGTVFDLAGRGWLRGAKVVRAWVFLEEDLLTYLSELAQKQTEERRLKWEATQEAARSGVPIFPPSRRRRLPFRGL